MDIFAKKSLGQHFLNSRHVLDQILEAAHVEAGETILEIGPGTGVLTEALLETGAKVMAIEKDDTAYNFLAIKDWGTRYTDPVEACNVRENIRLIHGDILSADAVDPHIGSYAVVANIPYYITGAILEKFLEYEPRPNRMILLVQKEVAERIVARDGKESILSVSVKVFGTPRIVATVPRGAFSPPPTVDSAILAIEHISDTLFKTNAISIQRFFALVKSGFAHKRKYLQRNLESVASPVILKEIWTTLGLDEKIRAEDLSPTQWLALTQLESQKS